MSKFRLALLLSCAVAAATLLPLPASAAVATSREFPAAAAAKPASTDPALMDASWAQGAMPESRFADLTTRARRLTLPKCGCSTMRKIFTLPSMPNNEERRSWPRKRATTSDSSMERAALRVPGINLAAAYHRRFHNGDELFLTSGRRPHHTRSIVRFSSTSFASAATPVPKRKNAHAEPISNGGRRSSYGKFIANMPHTASFAGWGPVLDKG